MRIARGWLIVAGISILLVMATVAAGGWWFVAQPGLHRALREAAARDMDLSPRATDPVDADRERALKEAIARLGPTLVKNESWVRHDLAPEALDPIRTPEQFAVAREIARWANALPPANDPNLSAAALAGRLADRVVVAPTEDLEAIALAAGACHDGVDSRLLPALCFRHRDLAHQPAISAMLRRAADASIARLLADDGSADLRRWVDWRQRSDADLRWSWRIERRIADPLYVEEALVWHDFIASRPNLGAFIARVREAQVTPPPSAWNLSAEGRAGFAQQLRVKGFILGGAVRARALAALLAEEPLPPDPFNPAAATVRPLRAGDEIVGAYSVGLDGVDDHGDPRRDVVIDLRATPFASP